MDDQVVAGDGGAPTPVTLPADVVNRYPRFSLYNSPYPAHDRGCAIDLYPDENLGRSPVAGEVIDTRTVRCPDRHYAVDRDHLILIDVDGAGSAAPIDGDGDLIARILHVEPAVEPGDEVGVGDPLGEMVRSGFFGQWVDNHVHLGFRRGDQNAYRAGGSLPLSVGVGVGAEPVRWDGVGTVVEVGPTHALLDAPAHPAPGDGYAAVAADEGVPLDGGLPHYAGGGTLDRPAAEPTPERSLSLLGTAVGAARGRDVAWTDVAVRAGGERAVGLSLFAARESLGAKLVAFDHDFAVGDEVRVEIRPTEDPVSLG